jgi:hypothetical protein
MGKPMMRWLWLAGFALAGRGSRRRREAPKRRCAGPAGPSSRPCWPIRRSSGHKTSQCPFPVFQKLTLIRRFTFNVLFFNILLLKKYFF